MGPWKRRKSAYIKYSILVTLGFIIQYTTATEHSKNISTLDQELIEYVDKIFSVDKYKILPGVEVERKGNDTIKNSTRSCCGAGRSLSEDVEEHFYKKFQEFTNNHVVSLKVPETARFLIKCKYFFCYFYIILIIKHINNKLLQIHIHMLYKS